MDITTGFKYAYFYKLTKTHHNKNLIYSIKGMNNDFIFGEEVLKELVQYYESLLAPSSQQRDRPHVLVHKTIYDATYNILNAPVTHAKIEKVVLSTNINKASGVDGFNARLFRACWSIIMLDVLNVKLDYFHAWPPP